MKKAEIDRQFDEIVAFAEIEKFMGTPTGLAFESVQEETGGRV